jgi:hypothetical protein
LGDILFDAPRSDGDGDFRPPFCERVMRMKKTTGKSTTGATTREKISMRAVVEEFGSGAENVTLSDRAFWLTDKESDPLWIPAFEAAEKGDLSPLINLLQSEHELRPPQRLQLADILSRHRLVRKRAENVPLTPVYDRAPAEQRLLLALDDVRDLKAEARRRGDWVPHEDAIEKIATKHGISAKALDQFSQGRGKQRNQIRKRLTRAKMKTSS